MNTLRQIGHMCRNCPDCLLAALVLIGSCAFLPAQTSSLSISSAAAIPGLAVTLAVNLDGPDTGPAALQWTLVYQASQISAIYVLPGSSAMAAGKTASCAGAAGQYTCLLVGSNATAMAPGVIANVQLTLAPGATTSTISLSNTFAADPSAQMVGLSVVGVGTIAVPALSAVTCTPGTLAPGGTATCKVTLDSPAPAQGVFVTLGSSNPRLVVPALATVPAGATSASFTATTGSSTSNGQSATVTATFNGSVKTAVLGLTPGTAPAPQLTIEPSSLLFVNGTNRAASKSISVASSVAGANFTAVASTAVGAGWLTVSPLSGSVDTQSALTITADSTGLETGTYTGTISVSTDGGAFASVAVTMSVDTTNQITVAPATLSFTYDQTNQGAPGAQEITVFSNPAGGAFTASINTSGAKWLSLGAASSSAAPATIPISVNPANLSAGSYSANITIYSSVANPVDVPVVFNVVNSQPKLSLATWNQKYAVLQGGNPTTGQIVIVNAGGGTLKFDAQVPAGHGSWLALNGNPSGSPTASAPASVGFTIDPSGLAPGSYTGQIEIQDTNSGGKQAATIVMAVSEATQTVTLSRSGLTYTAIEGGPAPPTQSIAVVLEGTQALNWVASSEVLPHLDGLPSDWMSVLPSTGNGGGIGSVTVVVNQDGLPPGQYYGMVRIDSPLAANAPQTVTVLLRVLPAGQPSPGIDISPGGLVFSGISGSQTTQRQQVTLFNLTNSEIPYSSATFSTSSSEWLVLSPSSGTLLPGKNVVEVLVNFQAISRGAQTTAISFGFGDGSFRFEEVEAIGLVQGAAGSTSDGVAGCSTGGASAAVMTVFQAPLDRALLDASVAQTVRVQAIDDCGRPLSRSSGDAVEIIFGNQDQPLDLHDTGSGIWEGVWVPQNNGSSVTLQAVVFEKSAPEAATAAKIATVVRSMAGTVGPPVVAAVVNAAASVQAIPELLAPGSYVAVYGTGLTGGGSELSMASPLSTTLAGTQLFVGDRPMPLAYVTPGQINALVPQDLNPNVEYQLSVLRGTTRSVPVSLIVTALQPGIFTLDSSGSGQGIAEIAGTTLLAGPTSNISRPIRRGSETLAVYCTGLGEVLGVHGEPRPPNGATTPEGTLYHTTDVITATIGGIDAPVTFSGLTPTLVGLYQVNVQVPAGVSPGMAVPLFVTVADPRSGVALQSNTVTIAVE